MKQPDAEVHGIWGRRGSGKSSYAKRLLQGRKRVIVFDSVDEYHAEGFKVAHTLNEVNQLVMAPALSAAFFAFTVLTRTPPPAQSSEAFDRFDLEKRGRIGYHELNVRALGFALSVWWAAKWAALRRKLAAELLPTLVRGNAYWTVVQTVNFRFVPPQCMVLFGNLASCVWTTYLCIVANRAAGDSSRNS